MAAHCCLVNPLQQLVLDRLAALDLSYRAAAEKADGLLTHGTLNNIALGRYKVDGISPRTRKGIALALDVPLSQVEKTYEEARADPPTEFRLPQKADKLTPTQRKAVVAFVNALLEGQ